MEKRYTYLFKGLCVGALLWGSAAPAFALGLSSPLQFQGNGSRVIDTGTPSASLPVTIVAEQTSPASNTSTSTTFSDPVADSTVSASAATGDYLFNGSVSASGFSSAWRAGGYLNDELSFTPAKSGAYSIDLIFNVTASSQLFSTTGQSNLAMTLSSWDGVSYTVVDTKNVFSLSGNQGNGSISGTYHLLLSGIQNPNPGTANGTIYLPYSIGVWGDAVNGSLTWTNIALDGVEVLDGTGTLVSAGSYSLCSNSLAFTSVASPVPLPGAIWLLGMGLTGLAGLRVRKNR
jgi:hypothetical protein